MAYDSFFTHPERGLVEVACWAHTRRHFHQALDTDAVRMGAVLAYIAHLYKVEKHARRSGITGEDLRLLRTSQLSPPSAPTEGASVIVQMAEYAEAPSSPASEVNDCMDGRNTPQQSDDIRPSTAQTP